MFRTPTLLHARRLLLLAAAVPAATLVAAPAAEASTIHCGQVITASITVSNDLAGCPHTGLVVGADGIVIDLNGHTLSGTATIISGFDNGIEVGSHSHVTIRNGRVRGFVYGVSINSGDFNAITKVSGVANTLDGVHIEHGHGNRVSSSLESGNGESGINLTNSSDSTLSGINATNNAVGTAVVGIPLFESGGNTVTQSTFAGNSLYGLQVYGERHDTITKNVASGTPVEGFDFTFLDSTSTISANKAIGNGWGFQVVESGYNGGSPPRPGPTLSDNQALHNTYGFFLFVSEGTPGDVLLRNRAQSNTYGFELYGTSNERLLGNVAGATSGLSGATGGNQWGIRVRGGSVGTVISGNTAHANTQGAGIWLDDSTTNTQLLGNGANHNATDGIRDDSASATFTMNSADFNGAFGLFAQPTDVDGGGNHAHGNGAGQCTSPPLTC